MLIFITFEIQVGRDNYPSEKPTSKNQNENKILVLYLLKKKFELESIRE